MKRISRRLVAFIAAAVMVMTMLSGCSAEESGSDNTTAAPTEAEQQKDTTEAGTDGEKSTEKTSIKFWHTYGDGEEAIFLNTVIPMWQTAHPEIEIEAVRQDSGSFHQMIITGFGTGEIPDVARIDIVNTAAYAAQGGLVALSDYADYTELKENFLEGPLSTNLYRDKYYGLPLDTNCKAAVVNMTQMNSIGLTEIPTTMEQFIEAAKAAGKPLLNVSGVGDWDLFPYFWLFGGVLTDSGYTKASGYLDSEDSINAINKLLELHADNIFTIKDVDGSVDAWDGISSGDYAMFFEGPWFFGSYDDKASQNIYPATIPTYNGKSASVVGGENIAVFSTSKNTEAAYEFAKFMTSEEVQLAMLGAGQIPVLKSLVSNATVTENPIWSVYMKQMESAQARIPSPNSTTIGEVWSDAMTNIFVNGADVKTELQNAAVLIDEQLK